MTGRALCRFFAYAAVLCLIGGPVTFAGDQKEQRQPPAGKQIFFNYFPSGASADLVNELWKKHPDYKTIWEKHKIVPDRAIGLADVNGDGKPEIFARHTEVYWEFCDKAGFACRTHVYASTDKGLVEIGDFMAADPIVVLLIKNKGINSLYAADSKDVGRIYSWNGKRYELSK